VKTAVDLDPLSGTAWQTLGWQLFANEDLPGGRGALGRAIEISPEDTLSHYFLGVDSILEGNPKAALLEFGRTLDQLRLQGVALAEHDLGHASESQKAFDELIVKYPDNWAYQIAETYAWRGDKDKAFEWLERAWAQHDWGLLNLKVDPFFRKLRSDPRFQAVLQRMNFPASTNP
jgi:tetratricopeptide (TPR) repeat protein